jgi:hypothetical protein
MKKLLLISAIALSSCSVDRSVQKDPYSMTVTVIAVAKVVGGSMVTVRHRDEMYQRLFIELPDSIVVGKRIIMPVFRRIK